jgi:hypothetical protein
MPADARVADVVIEASRRHAIVAEVKGSDIAHALTQLRSTVSYVRRQYDYVECKIFLKTPTLPEMLSGSAAERAPRQD